MPAGKFVAYYRVSTDGQGRSGLGLDGQKQAVRAWLNGGNWNLIAEFTEVESGKVNERPKLAEAIAECRLTGSRLVIAKLDRLSRDAAFLLGLERAGIEFVAADMPTANRLTVGIMAMVAEEEGKAISARTKAALAQAKIRRLEAGMPPLGGYRGGPVPDAALSVASRAQKAADFTARVAPTVRQMRDEGLSLRGIAAALTDRGVVTPRGGAWTAKAVAALLG